MGEGGGQGMGWMRRGMGWVRGRAGMAGVGDGAGDGGGVRRRAGDRVGEEEGTRGGQGFLAKRGARGTALAVLRPQIPEHV